MSRGFSMIEIMITIALLALLVALGLFMSMEAYRGATRRSERDVIVSMLERARSRAMANIDETSWSVCYDEDTVEYVIAKGSACPVGAHDRVEANAGVAAASSFSSTFPTVEFEQLTGNTTDETITVVQEGKNAVITTNHEGRISW